MKIWPYVLVALASVAALSCDPQGESMANSVEQTTGSTNKPLGVFQGTVPCSDCQGVETTLTLQDSLAFVLTLNYIGKLTDKVEISGTYTWEEGDTLIRLQGFDPDMLPTYYAIEKGAVLQLDLDGSKIDGTLKDQYRLIKAS